MDSNSFHTFFSKLSMRSTESFAAPMKRYLFLLLFVFIAGCGEDPPVDGVSDGERKAALEAIADNVIIPGFNELATSAAALESTVNALVASPNETSLEAAQAAWITMARQWKRIEYAQQGMLDQEREDSLIFKIDLGAADHTMRNATIDETALSTALLTSDEIDRIFVIQLPAKLQDIYVIEDLLFRTDDATALTRLTTDQFAGKRRELLQALTESLRQRCEAVRNNWWPSGENFRQQFINQFGTDLGSSLGMLMNDIVYLAEQMKNQKIGRPVGYLSAQIPQPDSVEARWSVQSLPFFIENLNGIEQAFTSDAGGRMGMGIDSLLNFMDAKVGDKNLSEAVITQINTMRALAQSLGSDLPNAVRTNRTKVDELFTECLVLLKLLKVDVVSQLGVMITTLEGDGD